ncbi:MAG: carboxypeptidase regulatory-like domain-containing protein [candidate division Zixibacteria bacterium]|nr:carboxypeptidase regulatory-like domain-containing protein [candidate division Zixibacteria bacterium]
MLKLAHGFCAAIAIALLTLGALSCSKSNDIVEQWTTIGGTVTSSITHEPIEGALVVAFHNDAYISHTYTPASGKYSVGGKSIGLFYVTCQKDGYEPFSRQIVSSETRRNISGVNMELVPY